MKTVLATVGAFLAAIAASACCWIPALLGAGVAGSLGLSATLTPYRPLFLGITAIFLAVGFYSVYRKRGSCCVATEGKSKRKVKIAAMWTVAVISIGSAVYPNIATLELIPPSQPLSNLTTVRTVRLALQGLDCEACSAPIKEKLRAVRGVSDVKVEYAKRIAIVGVGSPELADAALIQAVKDAGFVATIEPPIHETK
jgi:copper chaperone CopZ